MHHWNILTWNPELVDVKLQGKEAPSIKAQVDVASKLNCSFGIRILIACEPGTQEVVVKIKVESVQRPI